MARVNVEIIMRTVYQSAATALCSHSRAQVKQYAHLSQHKVALRARPLCCAGTNQQLVLIWHECAGQLLQHSTSTNTPSYFQLQGRNLEQPHMRHMLQVWLTTHTLVVPIPD
jgi:hypothetical protein